MAAGTQTLPGWQHVAKLRADQALYADVALSIQTKEGTLVPLAYNFAQSLVADRIEAQKRETGRVRVLILKARQEGISTWCASRIFHDCTLFSNRRGMVVTDKAARSAEIFAIYERFRDHVPDGLLPPARVTKRGRELAWMTDSRITVETAGDKDVGRASTVHRLHISELASWENAEAAWIALMQAVPTNGSEVYVEFTAQGIGNLAHRLWMSAEQGQNDWLTIFLPWFAHIEYQADVSVDQRIEIEATDDPWERKALDIGIEWEGTAHRLSVEQIAWRRMKIRDDFLGNERSFRQEFPSTAREAFVTSGDPFFDTDALTYHEDRCRPPIYRGTFIQAMGGWKLQHSEKGYVRIWADPDPDGHYVVFGDTASGKLAEATDGSLTEAQSEHGGRDYSAGVILKVSEKVADPLHPRRKLAVPCCRVVAEVHGRMAPEVFAAQIWAASAFWSCPGPPNYRGNRTAALTAIERNHSSGQTVIRELTEHWQHPNQFTHRRMNLRTGKMTAQIGWVTDGTTRMPMLDGFAAAIRTSEIQIPSPDIIRECFAFVRDDLGRPAAQEGTHDDRVIATAGAYQMLGHHRCGGSFELPEVKRADTPTGM